MKYHEPVMLEASVAWLAVRPGGTYVDVTFGGGGHSGRILRSLGEKGRLLAFDRDEEAGTNLPGDERLTLIQANFRHISRYLRMHGIQAVDGILADLGVSSHQFDVPERGFSIRNEGPLDLRMDRTAPRTAADIVNSFTTAQLTEVLRKYGEVQRAAQVAGCIVSARESQEIRTTEQLVDVLKPFTPARESNKFLAMVFQALRIEVNDELTALQDLLEQAPEILTRGGRMVVISYHSLEDRMVKHYFRAGRHDGVPEKDFYGNKICPWKVLTSKPLGPDLEEKERNNRSRSARMRVAERI